MTSEFDAIKAAVSRNSSIIGHNFAFVNVHCCDSLTTHQQFAKLFINGIKTDLKYHLNFGYSLLLSQRIRNFLYLAAWRIRCGRIFTPAKFPSPHPHPHQTILRHFRRLSSVFPRNYSACFYSALPNHPVKLLARIFLSLSLQLCPHFIDADFCVQERI